MLIYEVILEWIKWGNTEIPVCRLTTDATLDCNWLGTQERQEIILKNFLQVIIYNCLITVVSIK